MEIQRTIDKGGLMEELLRTYFISLGYFVVRGVKYRYENNDITDIDLYLYGRASSLTRERINVDIKNKKTPQAFERILWANGLKKLLHLNQCIVATTDNRPMVHSFGKIHNTIILDGAFLAKLKSSLNLDRLTEDELLMEFANHKNYNKSNYYKDWRFLYERSKSRLLTELDFSGFNSTILDISSIIDVVITDQQKRDQAVRMLYALLSHLLLIIDFILKDIAFLEQAEKEKKLSNGFKFGNLGKEGIDKIIEMAVKISGNRSAGTIMNSLDSKSTDIFKDYFSRNDTSKNIFNWAKAFEQLAFKKSLTYPEDIEAYLKGVISMVLDFNKVDRKAFFGLFPKSGNTSLDQDLS